MSNNSSQGGAREQTITTAVSRGDSFTKVRGGDGKGNEDFEETSTGPSKSNVKCIKEDGTTTEYADQSREWKIGKEIDDQDKIAVLFHALNGQFLFKCDKSKIDIIARTDINLYSEKGDITLTAPNGKIVFGSKEIRTGDLYADPVTGSSGQMPKIMMNSKSGGNFCGVKLPHKMCWDFIGPMSVGASRAAKTTKSSSSTDGSSDTTTQDINVGTPSVKNPIAGPWDNGDVGRAWRRCDPKFSPTETESESGVDYY
jgi:hypothetical protein